MTKEYIIEYQGKNNTTNNMSMLDKIIIIWFIAKAINILVLLFKRIFKK